MTREIPFTAPFKKTLLAASVSAALFGSAQVHAVILDATAQYALPGDSLADSDAATDPSSVSATVDQYGGSTGTASARGAGDDTGWMYSRAGGSGYWTSRASIQQSLSVTNTTGVSQSYSFDFLINRGSLSAFFRGAPDTGEFAEAGNEVSIRLNGTTLFMSSALLRNDAAGVTQTTGGTVLGTYTPGSDFYNWGVYSDTLDLGVFSAGDSFTLTYEIVTFSAGLDDGFDCSAGYGDYGFGDELPQLNAQPGGSRCYNNDGYSQFGDPNSLNASPAFLASNLQSTAANVPAPSALFLMGSGVAGLAFSRRRRNRKTA